MKFPLFQALLAGAAILTQSAGANPLEVVAVTGQEVSSAIRLGHAAANNGIVPSYVENKVAGQSEAAGAGHHGRTRCGSAILRAKLMALSENAKKVFSWTIVKTDGNSGLVRILPHPDPNAVSEQPEHQHPHTHHSKHRKFRHRCSSFFKRVHRALMALGPWEGRAVAFVLGCGIGVLLRMIWVLGVVMYRAIRGEREETPVYHLVHEHYVAESPDGYVSPPGYPSEGVQGYEYVDIKVPEDVGVEVFVAPVQGDKA